MTRIRRDNRLYSRRRRFINPHIVCRSWLCHSWAGRVLSAPLLRDNDQRMSINFGLTSQELSVIKRLSSPEKIQRFLDYEVGYNKEVDGETCRSPRRVLRDRIAHCAEGAFFAAAALRVHGREPLIVDLSAVRDDDHLLAVFSEHGRWGAIAKSNYAGLRFREPVYRSIRELVMSYYEHYYNPAGEKTLRAYSTRPINLKRFDRMNWMTTEEDLWEVCEYFCVVQHSRALPPQAERKRRRMDRRLYEAGMVGAEKWFSLLYYSPENPSEKFGSSKPGRFVPWSVLTLRIQ